jgi:ATP-dependent RNA helicase RhlE
VGKIRIYYYMSFEKLGLRTELLSAVASKGYTTPTPIQAQAIPVVLAGRDILAGSQTGTGKTASFALPMLQLLGQDTYRQNKPRALVLTPTRELAAQVEESFRDYGKNLRVRSTVIFGGVGMGPQVGAFRRGVDVVVATPGRLLDHAKQRTVDLSQVQILVLDEADRMLDMGFIHDIRKILALLPKHRQNLMFSATYSPDIRKLADSMLNKPALIEVAPRNTTVKAITQKVYTVASNQKRELLSTLIRDGKWSQVLVFTRTKHGANKLTKQLMDDGVSSAAIHGNKSQAARTRALEDFKAGSVRTLIATDIAARGLDINLLPHVVNYELPHVPEDYLHRIGRTGRAGACGIALSLVCEEERKQLNDIQKLIKQTIDVADAPIGFKRDAAVSPAARPSRPSRPRQDQDRRNRPVVVEHAPSRRREEPASGRRSFR